MGTLTPKPTNIATNAMVFSAAPSTSGRASGLVVRSASAMAGRSNDETASPSPNTRAMNPMNITSEATLV